VIIRSTIIINVKTVNNLVILYEKKANKVVRSLDHFCRIN